MGFILGVAVLLGVGSIPLPSLKDTYTCAAIVKRIDQADVERKKVRREMAKKLRGMRKKKGWQEG